MFEPPFPVHDGVIDLGDIPPLRQGNMRNIRVFPACPGLVLKTIRPDLVDDRGFFRTRTSIQNLRPRGCQMVQLREIEEFLIQCRRRQRQVGYRLPIAHVYGIVATTEGVGMLVERIMDAGGGLAPTIYELMQADAIGPEHVAALQALWRRCREEHVVVGDLHAANIAYTESRTGGPECVCIDGFGEKSFIPVHRFSKWANARKIDRVMRRMLELMPGRSSVLSHTRSCPMR